MTVTVAHPELYEKSRWPHWPRSCAARSRIISSKGLRTSNCPFRWGGRAPARRRRWKEGRGESRIANSQRLASPSGSSLRGAIATKQSRRLRKPLWIASLALAMTSKRRCSRDPCAPELCLRRRTKRYTSCNKREAKRRKAHVPTMSAQPQQMSPSASALSAAARLYRRRARLPALLPRHSPPATTPMAQPQNRVSSRHGAQVFCPFAPYASS